MSVPRLSIGLHPDRPAADVADLAALVERLGFGGVWVADSQNIFRDVYASLALVADRTTTITIGTGVTNPVTRHPAVIAGAIATVAERAGGRTVLGIGTGETAVETIGRPPAKIAEMEEAARVIRGLLAGKTVALGDDELTLGWPASPAPIVFASSGPRSLTAAGRSADGVYLKIGVHPDILAYAREHVGNGRAESGHDLDAYRTAVMVPMAINEDAAVARASVCGFAAAIARAASRAIPPAYLPTELAKAIAEIDRVSSRTRADQSYVEWLNSPEHASLVPDEIVEAFAIAGTPETVARRIAQLGEHDVTEVVTPQTMTEPGPSIEALGMQVLPLLAGV